MSYPSLMAPLADEACDLLKALAHPARMMICCKLREGELSVSELEAAIGVQQPRLSRELAKLRSEGLVETRREAKSIYYRLPEDSRGAAMLDAICAVMLDRSPPRQVEQSVRPPSKGSGQFAKVFTS